jgi:hypothetical protein
MIRPCDPCYFVEIAIGEYVAVMRCMKCGKLKITCPHCKGVEMRGNPRHGYRELSCIECGHTTNFHNTPDPRQLTLLD